jgi:hypothetical protein
MADDLMTPEIAKFFARTPVPRLVINGLNAKNLGDADAR